MPDRAGPQAESGVQPLPLRVGVAPGPTSLGFMADDEVAAVPETDVLLTPSLVGSLGEGDTGSRLPGSGTWVGAGPGPSPESGRPADLRVVHATGPRHPAGRPGPGGRGAGGPSTGPGPGQDSPLPSVDSRPQPRLPLPQVQSLPTHHESPTLSFRERPSPSSRPRPRCSRDSSGRGGNGLRVLHEQMNIFGGLYAVRIVVSGRSPGITLSRSRTGPSL